MNEDPAEEVANRTLRLALVAAAIGAQKVAELARRRSIARQLEDATQAARVDAAYQAARKNAVGWLSRFTPDEHMSADLAADAWTHAKEWADVDPQTFEPHKDRIGKAIRAQYGVDPDQVATEATLRGEADTEKDRGADSRRDAMVDAVAAGQVLADGSAEAADATSERANLHEADSIVSDDRADQLDATAAIVARHTEAGIEASTSRPRVTGARAQEQPARDAWRGGTTRPLPRGAARGRGRGLGR